MDIRTTHGPRAATLSIAGELTDEGATRAVREVDRLAAQCFYPEVVIEITSDGGQVQALDHLLDALDRWSRDGPRIVTRVPMRAASAAAMLASAGAEREAAFHAVLNYHGSRIDSPSIVTRQGAAAIGAYLDRTDHGMVQRLASRIQGAAEPDTPPEKAAECLSEPDAAILEGLLKPHRPASGPLESVRAVRGLRADCRAGGDSAPVEDMLRRLFEADLMISAHLALELGLIDRVLPQGGSPDERAEAAADSALRVPEWRALHPDGLMDKALLRRHTLILGESGSGKTASGVLPLAAALCRDPAGLACALVIDPKRELLGRLRAAAHPDVSVRPIDLDGDPSALCVMGRGAEALREDVRAGRVITAATRILSRMDGLDPNEELGTLTGRATTSKDPYWPREGARMAVSVLALALMLMTRLRVVEDDGTSAGMGDAFCPLTGEEEEVIRAGPLWMMGEAPPRLAPEPDFHDLEWDGILEDEGLDWALAGACAPLAPLPQDQLPFLGRELTGSCARLVLNFKSACGPGPDGAPGLNAAAAAEWLIQKAFWPGSGRKEGFPTSGKSPLPATTLVRELERFDGLHDEERDALGRVQFHTGLLDKNTHTGQYMGVAGHASTAIAAFANPDVARTLHFGIEASGREAPTLDFAGFVDGKLGPTVMVVQPGQGGYLTARALKAAFFEAILESPKRRRNGTAMPLAAYVADEFHRFVTADPKHGEQSFLDTCRSFGCACVLACQGVASMRHALAAGRSGAGDHAVDILLTNTANKIFFRTSEPASLRIMDSLAPLVGGDRLTSVRPPSAMAPGECYAALGDGRFERRQLGMLAEGPAKDGDESPQLPLDFAS